MVKGKIIYINPQRDPLYDLLWINGISDLQRGKLSIEVYGEDMKRVGGTSFATKIDGSWGSFPAGVMLHKILPQKLTILLETHDGEQTLDKQVYAWEGFPKTKPLTIPQNSFQAEPKISIVDLVSKLEKSLRKVVFVKPTKEFDIHDAIEQLLAGTNYEDTYTRDAESIVYSGRAFTPDFVFEELKLALEVKFCDDKKDVRNIIEEMNADIHPYTKKYPNVVFLVYDLGFIQDEDEFVSDFHKKSGVRIIIIKH